MFYTLGKPRPTNVGTPFDNILVANGLAFGVLFTLIQHLGANRFVEVHSCGYCCVETCCGVLKNSLLWKKLQNNELNLPSEETLPNRKIRVPYVFLGDDASSLNQNLMKTYTVEQKRGSKKRIYNYRLSRARRIIENVFGIMSSIFRVLRKPMLLSPEKATLAIMACVYLHNFLRKSKNSRNLYTPPGTFDEDIAGKTIPGAWQQGNENNDLQSFLPLQKVGRKTAAMCEAIRDEFAEYFSAEGSVSWQNKYA
jgi:hypothetical protein